MDEWKVGDPADWGDHVGVPDKPYMGYLNSDDYNEEYPLEPTCDEFRGSEADILGQKAEKYYKNYKYGEALIKIDEALLKDEKHSRNWNIKGKILCCLESFEESEKCFDKSLSLYQSDIVVGNKARMLLRWAWKFNEKKNYDKATELCMKATDLVKTHNTNENIEDYEYLKSAIDSGIRLKNFYEEQKKTLKDIGRKNLILMAEFYGLPEFGTKFKLVKENSQISIYWDGKKKGYVAHYDFTEEHLVSVSSELEDLPKVSYAEYVNRYRDRFHISRLLKRGE